MNNINQLLEIMKDPQMRSVMASNNPSQAAQYILSQNAGNNPALSNIINLMNSGNTSAAQGIMRNIAKSRGMDADQMVSVINTIIKQSR